MKISYGEVLDLFFQGKNKEILIEEFLLRNSYGGDQWIKNVVTNSREMEENDIFVPLIGEIHDGHDYIDKNLLNLASFVLSSRDDIKGNNVIYVDDTLKAYQDLGAFYREKMNFKVIGITGSSGKTTTKEMVYETLWPNFKVHKTHLNYNNEIGVPKTILDAHEDCEIIIVEMGMRALGEIETLTKIAKPNLGIITNVGVAHLGELKTRDNICSAKSELFKYMDKDGVCIYNGYDDYACDLQEISKGREFPVYLGSEGNLNLTVMEEDITYSNGVINYGSESVKFHFDFSGDHILYDGMYALGCGLSLGLSLREAVSNLKNFKNFENRLEIEERGGLRIIKDYYNANPHSTCRSLEILSKSKNRKIAILGDMLELGENEVYDHEDVGLYGESLGIDIIIGIGELGKNYVNKIKNIQGISRGFENKIEGTSYINGIIKFGDEILIKGSRGAKMEEILENLSMEVISGQ